MTLLMTRQHKALRQNMSSFELFKNLSRYKSLKSAALFFIKFSIILNEMAWTISSKDGGNIQEVETKKAEWKWFFLSFPLVSCDLEQRIWSLQPSVFSSAKLEKSYKYCKVAIESYIWVVLYVTIQYSTRCVCMLWRFDFCDY